MMNKKTAEIRITLGGGAFDSSLKSPKFRKKYKKAFTLAEVLITLAVVGVIAGFVVPRIKTKIEEATTVALVRQVYAELNNSYQAAIKKYGPPQYWGLQESANVVDKAGNLFGYHPSENAPWKMLLEGLKAEDIDGKVSAYQPKALHGIYGMVNKARPIFKFENGVSALYPATVASSTCNKKYGTSKYLQNVCGDIKVDINGDAPPNTVGKDVFVFYYTKYNIIPLGYVEDTARPISKFCNRNSEENLNGHSCSSWVIYKGNMDYLRKDIKW